MIIGLFFVLLHPKFKKALIHEEECCCKDKE